MANAMTPSLNASVLPVSLWSFDTDNRMIGGRGVGIIYYQIDYPHAHARFV